LDVLLKTGLRNVFRFVIPLCIVLPVGAGSLCADQPHPTDANPQLADPLHAFENIPVKARGITLRRGDTKFPDGGHFQGIQSYFDSSLNQQIYFVSRNSGEKGFFFTAAFDAGPRSAGEIRRLQYLPSDDRQPPLRHAGGMQLTGRYLVVGVEDNQVKRRSQIQFWDVSDPFAPKLRTPLTVIREGATPKDKTAGAVGIVNRANDHLLVVANWDARALDFYASNGRPLSDDACRFALTVRWNRDTANRLAWKPDRNWGSYQSINLVSDRDTNLFMLGFHTADGRNVIDFFSVDPSNESTTIIRKLSTKNMVLSRGAQFQYSGGISINASGELSCYATERDDDAKIILNVAP
jgi:hypothetical protein